MFSLRSSIFAFIAIISICFNAEARIIGDETGHDQLKDTNNNALSAIFEIPLKEAVKITASDIDILKSAYGLKAEAVLKLQELYSTNIFKVNGKDYKLDDLVRVEIFTAGAKYSLDNIEKAIPEMKVFTKRQGKETLTVSFDIEDKLKSILVSETASGITIAELVPTAGRYLATITDDMIDHEYMDKHFKLAEGVSNHIEEQIGDKIRDTMTGAIMSLRSNNFDPCTEFDVIELAIDYESSFCTYHGGPEESIEAVAGIIAATSIKYQQEGLCRKIQLSNLDGYCDPNNDPYVESISTNLSGCSGYGLLTYFGEYFNANKANVTRDASILFSGTGLECQTNNLCVVGCANIASLCQKESGYGVVYAAFVNSTNFRSILVAHELGHVAGALHQIFGGGENIMAPTITSYAKGFSKTTVDKMNCYSSKSTCPKRLIDAKKKNFGQSLLD